MKWPALPFLAAFVLQGHEGKKTAVDLAALTTQLAALETSKGNLFGAFRSMETSLDLVTQLAHEIELLLTRNPEQQNQHQLELIKNLQDHVARDLEEQAAKAKQDAAEAKQDAAEAKQDAAEAKQDAAEAKQDAAEAKQDAAEAKQDAAEAKALADVVAADMPALAGGVDEIVDDDDTLDGQLRSMEGGLNDTASAVQIKMGNQLGGERIQFQNVEQDLQGLENFALSRTCEYGTFMAAVPSTGTISFTTTLSSASSVTYSIIGFRSHIVDRARSRNMADLLGFRITFPSVTNDMLTYKITKVNDDTVEPKDVVVRFMACNNLLASP